MNVLIEEMKQAADGDQCLKLQSGAEILLVEHDKSYKIQKQ